MRCNLRETMLKLDRPVPRYTSYPTAPHFQPLEDEQRYPQMLSRLPERSRLSLYLHVPFCPKMCWYCGCHTKITQRYGPVEDYAHLMIREIEILADALGLPWSTSPLTTSPMRWAIRGSASRIFILAAVRRGCCGHGILIW